MTKAKMATDIPAAITMPDRVETRLGTLQFTDGFPDDATVEKVFDNLDFQHAVQAFLTSMPAASLMASRQAARGFGPDNQTVHHLRVVDGLALAVPHREHGEHLRGRAGSTSRTAPSSSRVRRTRSGSPTISGFAT